MNQNLTVMGAYRSINMIIALTCLYLGFTAIVIINLHNTPNQEPEYPAAFYGGISPKMSEEVKRGKVLFRTNCASCHAKSMTVDLTGPALLGVSERWAEHPKEDLYGWIRNSEKMIAAKHPRAIEVAKEWNFAKMNSMQHLTEENITDILSYIER